MSSIVLIGMPGVGKSTVGVLLAKELALEFVDTDILIQQRSGKRLQDILDELGYLRLRELEQQAILDHDLSDAVVATGGSVVYGTQSMQKLGQLGQVVYLSASIESLLQRIESLDERGIAAPPHQNLAEIALEREPLYSKYADIEISTDGLSSAQVLTELLGNLPSSPS